MAQFKPINAWEPQHGDFVIWHGWFTHWFGIVMEIDRGQVTAVKAGLPFLLFQFDEYEMEHKKNRVTLPVSKIRSSKGGEFAIMQRDVWFI